MAEITLREAKSLVSSWTKGTFPTVSESIKYHFARHGKQVPPKTFGSISENRLLLPETCAAQERASWNSALQDL